jgi:hypothetical protein
MSSNSSSSVHSPRTLGERYASAVATNSLPVQQTGGVRTSSPTNAAQDIRNNSGALTSPSGGVQNSSTGSDVRTNSSSEQTGGIKSSQQNSLNTNGGTRNTRNEINPTRNETGGVKSENQNPVNTNGGTRNTRNGMISTKNETGGMKQDNGFPTKENNVRNSSGNDVRQQNQSGNNNVREQNGTQNNNQWQYSQPHGNSTGGTRQDNSGGVRGNDAGQQAPVREQPSKNIFNAPRNNNAERERAPVQQSQPRYEQRNEPRQFKQENSAPRQQQAAPQQSQPRQQSAQPSAPRSNPAPSNNGSGRRK